MGEDDELRFICKLCDKRYQCGKSLGGHMRSHVIAAKSAESQPKVEAKMKMVSSFFPIERDSNLKGEENFDVAGNSSYGLRENPKKTWRIVSSSNPVQAEDNICKQCGKGFHSLKALCGHMACHSDKERVLKDDYSWSSKNMKPVTDSHSDTESDDPILGKLLKSKRYKRVVIKSSFNLGNESSFDSEIDEQDQEEIAMCLMMLSRDSGNWGGVNSVVESSDNNSVVLETKSSTTEMRIDRKEGLNSAYNHGDDETLETNNVKGKKLRSFDLGSGIAQFENSDSGYFINGAKQVDSDCSVDGVLRNGGCKKLKVAGGAKFECGGTQLQKDVIHLKCYDTEGPNNFSKKKELKMMKYDSRKRMKDGSDNPESSDAKVCKNATKSKYECLTCGKTFSTFQGLGGHRPCHRRSNVGFESTYQCGKNNVEGDSPSFIPNGNLEECGSSHKKLVAKEFSSSGEKKTKSKKTYNKYKKSNKGRECPICRRIFKNGQALGGHKRSHFIGGHDDNSNQTPEIKPELPDLFDLNLPAPVEDEADRDDQFIPS